MANIKVVNKSPSAPPSLGRQLNFAAATGSTIANRILEPHGLTLAQWVILVSIWRNGELGISALARLTGNAPPATSRIVDRMVAGGLLLRRQDPDDRRAVTIGLTEAGAALRPLETVYQQVNDILTSDLTDDEVARLFDLLGRVDEAGRRWLKGA